MCQGAFQLGRDGFATLPGLDTSSGGWARLGPEIAADSGSQIQTDFRRVFPNFENEDGVFRQRRRHAASISLIFPLATASSTDRSGPVRG